MKKKRFFDRVDNFVIALLLSIISVYTLYLCIYTPYHNWDIITYIAAAKSFEEQNINSLHRFAYTEVQQLVSEAKYEELVGKEQETKHDIYRYTISTDIDAFNEQMPFYEIRLIYNGLVFLLYKAGMNIGVATYVVPGVAVVIAISLLFSMSVSFLAKPFVYATPFAILLFNVPEVARNSSPDGLAFLAIVLSAWLYLNKHIKLLILILIIQVGIRTDLILFTIPLFLLIYLTDKRYRWQVALSASLSIVIYLGIGLYYENPGWSTIFYFTLVDVLTHPISNPPTLTFYHYFYTLYNVSTSFINNDPFILYTLTLFYSLYYSRFRIRKSLVIESIAVKPAIVLSVACAIFVGLHLVAFPVIWDRFFAAPYIIGTFAFLMIMSDMADRPSVVT